MKPIDLLEFYKRGLFPMADSHDEEGFAIIEPNIRGILPLPVHCPKSLKKFIRQAHFNYSMDKDFVAVITQCAAQRQGNEGTWINQDIIYLFTELHKLGYAHSVEVWDQKQNLVGGLYGLALGGCFFGESMFSTTSNASKCALIYLSNKLCEAGFTLLDAQFRNPHLEQFGLIEIEQEDFVTKLQLALRKETQPKGLQFHVEVCS